jgi:hypothetical protein
MKPSVLTRRDAALILTAIDISRASLAHLSMLALVAGLSESPRVEKLRRDLKKLRGRLTSAPGAKA